MKKNIIIMLLLALFSFGLNQKVIARKIKWEAKLYSKNKNYVEVIINTKKYNSQTQITDILFCIEFKNKFGSVLKRDTLAFNEKKENYIIGGNIYREFFPVNKKLRNKIVSVSGIFLQSHSFTFGTLFFMSKTSVYLDTGDKHNEIPDQVDRNDFNEESLPKTPVELFNGKYKLFINGIKMKGVFKIENKLIGYKDKSKIFGRIHYSSAEFECTIKENWIEIEFLHDLFQNISKIEGYISQSGNSIAGTALIGNSESVGFYALKK